MDWDESKHSRDDDGRFTDGTDMTITKLKAVLRAGYDAPLNSDSSLNEIQLDKLYEKVKNGDRYFRARPDFFGKKKGDNDESIPNPPKDVYGFRNKALLNRPDHVKHAKDFGFKTQKEYEDFCVRFWNSNRGNLYYAQRIKRFVRCDGLMVCFVTVDGHISTLFEFRSKKEKETYRERDSWREV